MFPINSLEDLTLDGLRILKMRVEMEIQCQEEEENEQDRKVYDAFKDHVIDAHSDILEDCGCCGASHFPEFAGDCREDWERF